jgi:hypothetical protein
VLEIQDNAVYEEPLSLAIPAATSLEIRAANQRRPVLRLTSPLSITGAAPTEADQPGGQLTLDGLLMTGQRVEILDGDLGLLQLKHCTLVPGWALTPEGTPVFSGRPSLVVLAGNEGLNISLVRTISGGLDLPGIARVTLTDSLVDGTDSEAILTTTLVVQESTVLGPVTANLVEKASNSIFTEEVTAERKQEGCVRFCYLPPGSRVPRRYHCQPDVAIEKTIEDALKTNPSLPPASRNDLQNEVLGWLRPSFTDPLYGRPGYGQLHAQCPVEIKTGADDQAEMGVFHHLKQPQRESNLRTSLGEYLRVGLEAGIFYVT